MTDVAFYDDALLVDAERLLLPVLRAVEGKGIRFHTPNGLHARLLTPEIAAALVRAGFRTFRLSL